MAALTWVQPELATQVLASGVLVVPVVLSFSVAVAQLGLALGSRVGERPRENAERLAATALIGLGIYVLVARLTA